MRYRLIVFFVFVFVGKGWGQYCPPPLLLSQCTPAPFASISIDSIASGGSSSFCIGQPVGVINNSTGNIDSSWICWGDGTDTIFAGSFTGTIFHQFNFPPNGCHVYGDTTFDVVIYIKDTCSSGFTIRKGTSNISVRFKPHAAFFIADTTCVDVPVTINTSQTCSNAYESDSLITRYYLNFGDAPFHIDSGYTYNPSGTNSIFVPPLPQHIYSTAGTYTVTLIIQNGCGIDSMKQTIIVLPDLIINPTLTGDTCATAIFQATLGSLGGVIPDSVLWIVTPSTNVLIDSATGINPQITIVDTGTYYIEVTAYNYCCGWQPPSVCYWKDTIHISSGPKIKAHDYLNTCDTVFVNFINDFQLDVNDSLICSIDSLNSSGGTDTIYISHSHNPPADTLFAPGTYIITVSAINKCDSIGVRDTVIIYEPTVISVTASAPPCAPDSIYILNVISNNPISAYNWWATAIVGPGTITPTFVSTTFTTQGFFVNLASTDSLHLLATSPQGCCDTATNNCLWDSTFIIGQKPTINYVPPLDGCLPITLNFNPPQFDINYEDSVLWHIDSIANGVLIPIRDTTTLLSSPQPFILYGPDTFIVTVTAFSNCPDSIITDTIFINPFIQVSMPPVDTVCFTHTPIYLDSIVGTPSPANLCTFYINAISFPPPGPRYFYPSQHPNSTSTIICVYNQGALNCESRDTMKITVVGDVVNAGSDTTFCDNATSATLFPASPLGGVWSGSPAIINPLTGLINPSLISGGKDTIYYSYTFINGTFNCVDSDTLVINSFSFSPFTNLVQDTACTNYMPVTFYNPSIGDNVIWDFGDATAFVSSTAPTVTHPYAITPDITYYITAIVSQINSPYCSDTLYDTLHIINPPNLLFLLSDDTICQNETLYIYDNATIQNNYTTYEWVYLGTSHFVFNPDSIVFPPPASTIGDSVVYPIVVYAYNQCDTDSISFNVTVYSLPVSNFIVQSVNNPPCSGDTVSLTFAGSGSPSNFTWLINGVIVSNNQNIVDTVFITGTIPTTYNVTLIVENRCDTSSYTYNLLVNPSTVNPLFSMSTNNACVNDSIMFTSFVPAYQFIIWNFGDGNTGNGPVVSHPYNAPGTYYITQYVYGWCGNDSIKDSVVIHNLPVPVFTNSTPLCSNQPVSFYNTSTGGTLIYTWYFGDGFSSNNTNPVHQYALGGTYDVTLIVTTIPYGCIDSITHTITVNDAPVAQLSVLDDDICQSDSVMLSSTTVGVNYVWDLGNSTTLSGNPVSYQYPDSGTYYVTLTVTDIGNFCEAVITSGPINVHKDAIANFNYTQTPPCSLPDTLQFINNSEFAGIYDWWLNGNSFSTNSSAFIDTCSITATYSVTLIANNINNCPDTIILPVTFQAPANALFNFAPDTICIGTPIQFINLSVDSANSVWSFGDSSNSILNSPLHIYADTGSYNVMLIVENDSGCVDTLNQIVNIYPYAIANFTWQQRPLCELPDTIFFNDTSINAFSYNWNFGSYGVSNGPNPHLDTLTTSATFLATLIVNTNHNCPDTISQLITYHGVPQAMFYTSPDTICDGTLIQFTDSSLNAFQYFWDFGNGGTSVSQFPPAINYNGAGTYNVTLIIMNDTICADTLIKSITVNPNPVAHFGYTQSPTCGIPTSLFFKDSSTVDSSIIIHNWTFNFGGFTSSINKNPVLNPVNVSGTFPVTLQVMTDNGCTDTTTLPVTIFEQPTVKLDIPTDSFCLGHEINIPYTFTNANTFYWTFGDGFSSTLSNPNHAYSATGIYTIKLVVSNDAPCSDSDSVVVVINPNPFACFKDSVIGDTVDYLDLKACSFHQFIDSSSSDVVKWIWNFGDGSPLSNDSNPKHEFMNDNIYNVSLQVINKYSCTDDTVLTVNVSCGGVLLIPDAIDIANNRLFIPVGSRIESYKIEIYSSFGDRIWYAENELTPEGAPNVTWDGTVDGKHIPQGAYVWRAEAKFKDGSQWKGMSYKGESRSLFHTLTIIR